MIDIQNEIEITSNFDIFQGRRRHLNTQTNVIRETRAIRTPDGIGEEYEEYGATIRHIPCPSRNKHIEPVSE